MPAIILKSVQRKVRGKDDKERREAGVVRACEGVRAVRVIKDGVRV